MYHIIMTMTTPPPPPPSLLFSREAANTIFTVFSLTRPRIRPTIYHPQSRWAHMMQFWNRRLKCKMYTTAKQPFGEWVSTTSDFCFRGENVLLVWWDDVCFYTKPTCRVWFFKKSGVVFLFLFVYRRFVFCQTMNDLILFKNCLLYSSLSLLTGCIFWTFIFMVYRF